MGGPIKGMCALGNEDEKNGQIAQETRTTAQMALVGIRVGTHISFFGNQSRFYFQVMSVNEYDAQ